MHSLGVIHGDLKASNVLLQRNLEPSLSDFGLSKLQDGATSAGLKGSGSIPWMSPEVVLGGPKTAESDMYAFGMTIAEVSRLQFCTHEFIQCFC